MIPHPGTSTSLVMLLPFPQPTHGPAPQPPWGQPPPPLLNVAFPPGSCLVLPAAIPRMPAVAGDGGCGPNGAGNVHLLLQLRTGGQPVEPLHSQTLVYNQTRIILNAPEGFCGAGQNPAPIAVPGSSLQATVPAPTMAGTQASQGGWPLGLPPPTPPPAAQLAPMIFPVNNGPPPQGADREHILPTPKAQASPDNPCNSTSVYENFRRWQHFKALARRLLPQSPDTEALSCFLIPVLRTLAQRRPTMPLEEGLRFALREWQHKSNFDRMIFYEMAEKFMEFEEEEEMQMQKLEWMKGKPCQPPLVSPALLPQGPPAPVAVQQPGTVSRVPAQSVAEANATPGFAVPSSGPFLQEQHVFLCAECPRAAQGPTCFGPLPGDFSYLSPSASHPLASQGASKLPGWGLEIRTQSAGCAPRKASSKALPACPVPPRYQGPQDKTPKEIPPEAVKEYMEIMDTLLGPTPLSLEPPDGHPEEDTDEGFLENEGSCPDPEMLSYIEHLCSQVDFVTKAEAIIHPRFLEELLSPDPQLDLTALSKELEKEEGLTADQVMAKHCSLKEDGAVGATPSHGVPQLNPSNSESGPQQSAQSDNQGPRLGARAECFSGSMSSQDLQRHAVPDTPLCRPEVNAVFSGHRECPSLGATKDARSFRGGPSVGGPHTPLDNSSENEEELPSLSFLLASQHHLLPLGFARSEASAEDLPCLGAGNPCRAPKPLSTHGRDPRGPLPHAAKSRKQALQGGQGPAKKKPCPVPQLRASEGQAQALGSVGNSQAQKRKHDHLVTRRRKKHHSAH
ncbi:NUT family member 2G [Oryctolagus cuniculus]|uniref:NUT family member 2G n=1 Tax=Oryctolagus cuniculus TaxID=9986 RepID=UPI003879EFFF